MNLPSLNESLLLGLDFLKDKNLKLPIISKDKRVLVLGSGNALVTGKILFKDYFSFFGNENNYLELLKRKWDKVVLISASGKKHFVDIYKKVGDKGIVLTTNTSLEGKGIYVFPRREEPYTYNITTYLSMILAMTGEDSGKIKKKVLNLDKLKINFSNYDSFYFILPKEFVLLKEMFQTKFDELFGGKICFRCFSYEESKHAKTVVNSKKELFISFGVKNNDFGLEGNRINVPFSGDFGELFSLGYYLIGKIQEAKPQWFKRDIGNYCLEASKLFGQEIEPVVRGNGL